MKIALGKKGIESDNKKLSFVVAVMVVNIFIINFFPDFGIVDTRIAEVLSLACKIIMLMVLVFSIGAILRRISSKAILYIVAVCLVILINAIIGRADPNCMSTISSFLVTVFPMILVVSSIHDYGQLGKALLTSSRIVIIIVTIGLIYKQNISLRYSMALSNSLTLPVVMCMADYYQKRNKSSLLLAILGTITIFLVGSRGSLIGVVAFVIIIIARELFSREYRIRGLFFIFVSVPFIVFFNQIMSGAYKLLQSRGLESRTLWMIANNLLGYQSNREIIYSGIVDEIKRNPFVMHGIAGEYSFAQNTYAHNIVLELLMDFGCVIGTVCVVGIFILSAKTIMETLRKPSSTNLLRLSLWCVSIPIAFISGTIWTSVYLWMWLFVNIDYTGKLIALNNVITNGEQI